MGTYNIYLGGNELIVACKGGTCVVSEAYRDYSVVFTGTYAECVAYCNNRWAEYQESIIG